MHDKSTFEKQKFEAVFRTHFSKVKNFITKILKSEIEAEDLAQDIFAKLWVHREILDDIKSLDSFLYRMARNAIFNYIKHQSVTNTYIDSLDKEVHHADDIYGWVYANEIELLVNNVVTNMPPQRKRIYLMSRKEGLSNTEIAEKLNLSKRTVDCHLTLALAQLKKVIYSFNFLFFC